MNNNDDGYSVIQTYDGGFMITGQSQYAFSNTDIILIKTDAAGNIIWSNSYGGSILEYGSQVQQTPDSSYVVAGASSSSAGNYDFTFLKTDPSGDPVFINVYEGANDDQARSFIQTSDGGYILAGSTNSFGTLNTDAYIIRTDPFGDPIWARTFGGVNTESALSILPSQGNGYVLGGGTTTFGGGLYDGYMIKTDSAGNSGCNDTARTIPNLLPGFTHVPIGFLEMPFSISILNPATQTSKGSAIHGICLVDAVSDLNVKDFNLYPNPASQTIYVENLKSEKFMVLNVSGQTVLKGDLNQGLTEINIKELPEGIYFLKSVSQTHFFIKAE
jgi:hypothetical protein